MTVLWPWFSCNCADEQILLWLDGIWVAYLTWLKREINYDTHLLTFYNRTLLIVMIFMSILRPINARLLLSLFLHHYLIHAYRHATLLGIFYPVEHSMVLFYHIFFQCTQERNVNLLTVGLIKNDPVLGLFYLILYMTVYELCNPINNHNASHHWSYLSVDNCRKSCSWYIDHQGNHHNWSMGNQLGNKTH